jgi:hypothetical protein
LSSGSVSRTSRSNTSAGRPAWSWSREHTTNIGGKGEKREIEGRCQELRQQIAETKSDREKLEERLAKLSGGVAVIRVGAPAEAEMKSRREAFDDAIHATRAAIAEGVVPGAGLALLRAIPAVEEEADRLACDERAGALILRRALEAPTRQIGENSGADGGVVVEKMRGSTGNVGFDAAVGGLCRSRRSRDHRSDQGGATRSRERRLCRRHSAPDRSYADRSARTENGTHRTRSGLTSTGSEQRRSLLSTDPQPCLSGEFLRHFSGFLHTIEPSVLSVCKWMVDVAIDTELPRGTGTA